MNLLTLFWGEGACRADSDFETRETAMASLSKKGHRPSGTNGGKEEHASNAEKNRRECSEGKRPSESLVGEVERPNESFDGDGERPNASFGGGEKRSSASFDQESERTNTSREGERMHHCDVENGRAERSLHRDKGTRPMALFRGEQEDGSTFENRRGESSGQMNLKIETEKGNNERDKNIADVEEASSLLLAEFFLGSDHDDKYVGNQYELENACEQMAFKISHVEVGSEGSTPCLVEAVAKDCIEGVTTCLKCLHDMTKSSNKKLGRIQYESHEERYTYGERSKSCKVKNPKEPKTNSNFEKHGRIQYESRAERYVNGVRSVSNIEEDRRNIQYESHEERYANGVISKSNLERYGRNIQYESTEVWNFCDNSIGQYRD